MKITEKHYESVKSRLSRNWSVTRIAEAVKISETTVRRIRDSSSFKHYKRIAVIDGNRGKDGVYTIGNQPQEFNILKPRRKKFLGIF